MGVTLEYSSNADIVLNYILFKLVGFLLLTLFLNRVRLEMGGQAKIERRAAMEDWMGSGNILLFFLSQAEKE